MSAGEYAVGDRVKVTLEGEVSRVVRGDTYTELRVVSEGGEPHFIYTESATIEKVEPPVEVFKPGDVVRNRKTGRTYPLTKTGFVGKHGDCYRAALSQFTSEEYERVDL